MHHFIVLQDFYTCADDELDSIHPCQIDGLLIGDKERRINTIGDDCLLRTSRTMLAVVLAVKGDTWSAAGTVHSTDIRTM